ncbi:AccI family restriction endonuclease [Armatimonas sp.]|uniref:AccI family restriction endonuclease n=1 Tax=Armatimonas sp. TaxID=1872638 RepID=UPI003753B711
MANIKLAAHHPFERALSVASADLQRELRFAPIAWADFLLNPRRLRGSDFLMRWSQGVWSEHRLTKAVEETQRYFALPYGPSGTAPAEDVRAFELYFERLEAAGLGQVKRPDLLIFRQSNYLAVDAIVDSLGGIEELPFIPETDLRIQELLGYVLIAVECENSLWVAHKMPDYQSSLRPQRRLGGKPGLKKSCVTPTIIVKEEDRNFLRGWQEQQNIPIHIWHAFYDRAFGISFDRLEELIVEGLIEGTKQIFQAPNGATTQKVIYKTYHHYAYPLGETEGEVTLIADSITDANGHILPFVRFEGGQIKLADSALKLLDEVAQ